IRRDRDTFFGRPRSGAGETGLLVRQAGRGRRGSGRTILRSDDIRQRLWLPAYSPGFLRRFLLSHECYIPRHSPHLLSVRVGTSSMTFAQRLDRIAGLTEARLATLIGENSQRFEGGRVPHRLFDAL